MTYGDVSLLIDYNYWARDRLLEAVAALTPEQFTRPLGNSFSSIRDTIAHICDAESIWLRRWRGEQPQGFQKHDRMADLAAAREEWAGIERGMREMVETVLAAAQRPVSLNVATEPSEFAAWHTVPSFAIVATQDNAIGPANELFVAKRATRRRLKSKPLTL